MAVDASIVEAMHHMAVDDLYRGHRVEGDVQVACQAVATPTRDDAQSRRGVHQRACHLIDRAVASHGHHHLHPIGGSLLRQFGGMSRTLGVANLTVEAIGRNVFTDGSLKSGFIARARNGVDDKKDLLHKKCVERGVSTANITESSERKRMKRLQIRGNCKKSPENCTLIPKNV